MDMRPLPTTPTEVVAYALLRDTGQGMSERVDVPGLHASIFLQRGSWNHHVPCFAQPWIIDLQDEPSVDDGTIFGLHGLGNREHVFFFGGVVLVLASADHPRRDSGHKGLLHIDVLHGGLEGGEFSLQQRLAPIGDGSLAHHRWCGGRHRARQVLLVVLTKSPPRSPGVDAPRPRAPYVARWNIRGISRQRYEAR